MRKILISYATAGEGHKRAAFALKAVFDTITPPDCEIKLVDSLDYANRCFKWFYSKYYLFMVTYIPTIWGFFYYLLDLRLLYPLVKSIRRFINRYNTIEFERFLQEFRPDIVIATHFLTSEVVSALKRRAVLNTRLVTCVTDFRMHSFWFSHQTDIFFVGFAETKDDIIKKWKYAPEDNIRIAGIPTHTKFYESKNRYEMCTRHGLAKDLFTVLITGGGFGVGPIMALVNILAKLKEPLQLLVVCGHNEMLRDNIVRLATRSPSGQVIIKAYGFIDYVDELMAASDLAVTKAGGLICSEAIANQLPLIIISPIPGQEGRNCRLLLKNKAALRIKRPCQIERLIKKIYQDNEILSRLKENVKRIRRDNPAVNIAGTILGNHR